MQSPSKNFISPATYNGLPHVSEVADAPTENEADLDILRALLTKHNIPASVSIRLVHKHFDVSNEEIMVVKNVHVPSYGTIQVMRPTVTNLTSQFYGHHFFVNALGFLEAYEYALAPPAINLFEYKTFVTDFTQAIVQRGLEQKFGLKLSTAATEGHWTEFEFCEERSTMMIPHGLPTPPTDNLGLNVTTEFHADLAEDDEACSHSGTTSCIHCRNHGKNHQFSVMDSSLTDQYFYFGGQMIMKEMPFHGLVIALTQVW